MPEGFVDNLMFMISKYCNIKLEVLRAWIGFRRDFFLLKWFVNHLVVEYAGSSQSLSVLMTL